MEILTVWFRSPCFSTAAAFLSLSLPTFAYAVESEDASGEAAGASSLVDGATTPSDEAPEPKGAETTPAQLTSHEGASRHHGSFSLDPLGLVLFGPRASAELGLGSVSLLGRVRWFDVGLLSHTLFLNSSSNFAFSFGAALEARYYFGKELEGAFAGVTAEVLRTSIETPSMLIVANSLYLVPQLTGGYRFAFDWFFLDPSASLGYAAQLDAKVENMPGGSQAQFSRVENKSSIYGSAGLDVGLFF